QGNVPPNTGEFGALPATLDGTAAPAGGSPEPIIEQQDDIFGFPQDELLIRRFSVDWTTPSNSSLSAAVAVPTAAFDSDMCDFSTNCIAQPKTTEGVDAVADRLMYRASYRNLGSRDSLLINQTVDGHGNDTAGIRWTEVRGATTNAPSIRQQHTYSP